MATKRRPPGSVLRGQKEILRHLRATYEVAWCRTTLWRRRRRATDPFPGVLQLVEQRAIFITTTIAVRRWVKRNADPPAELFEDDG